MMHAPLALPTLASGIPHEYYVPGGTDTMVPLAIALIEAGLVTDALFQGENLPLTQVFGDYDERELCTEALTRWWTALKRRYPLRHFRWNLFVQSEIEAAFVREVPTDSAPFAWFCLVRPNELPIPRVPLARGVERLERQCEGFGQTVLALLHDALAQLPEAFTPWRARDYAEWLHWDCSDSDTELIALHRNECGCAEEEAKAHVLTREEFYGDMPPWVCRPRRMCSRKKIVRAARDEYAKSVVAACDALSALACSTAFDYDVGAQSAGLEPVDAFIYLHWNDDDQLGRVIDDAMEMAWNSGESCEYLDAACVALTGPGLSAYITRMDRMMHLAMLTEQLLELIGAFNE